MAIRAPVVVYITGSSEAHVAVAALKAGASDFVAKTVDADLLILPESALARGTAGARSRRDASRRSKSSRGK